MHCLQLSGKSPRTPPGIVEQGEVVCQEKLYHAVFDILLVSFFPLSTESTKPVFNFYWNCFPHEVCLVENIMRSSYFSFVISEFFT